MPFGLTWRQVSLLIQIAPRVVDAAKREAPLIRELATIFEKDGDVAPEASAKSVAAAVEHELSDEDRAMLNRESSGNG